MSVVFKEGLFAKQVAVVTGGGSGIGYAVAKELGVLGATVVISGRREELLRKSAESLSKLGIEVAYKKCDIRDVQSVQEFVEFVDEKYHKVDILVNNAGGQYPSPAEGITPKVEGMEAVVRNNLLGTWNVTIAFAKKFFIPNKSGRIINVIAQIYKGFPGMMHTGAARAGVENMTKTLAVEWAPYNIKVVAVAPGWIKTSELATYKRTGTDQYPPELFQLAASQVPLGRAGTAEEVATLIVFLSSETAAAYITGQTYYIDGASSLSGLTWGGNTSLWRAERRAKL